MDKELEVLRNAVQRLTDSDNKTATNHDRRVLYSNLGLLRIRIESMSEEATSSLEKQKLLDEIDSLSGRLKLKYVSRYSWYHHVDKLICGLAGWIFFATAVILLCIPVLLVIRPADRLLMKYKLISPHHCFSQLIKRCISETYLLLSGIVLIKDGEPYTIESGCPLVCFTHASITDAFIIAAMTPVQNYTLAKKELFLVPLLSQGLATFGGIPIDRGNRSKAVMTLKSAIESAKSGDCVMISPEGTRSTSGQLALFKKGPFYIWEQLQSPVIPLVIAGAYELCPPGNPNELFDIS